MGKILMRVSDRGGEGVEGEALGTGKRGGGGGGDEEEAAGLAEGEIVGGGFVALPHRLVGYEDEAGAEGFGFGADGFFGCGDEGGDEDAAVGGGVEPAPAVAFILLRGVGTVDYDLLFEGAIEKLEIAIGLIGAVADLQIVDTAEKLGMGAPDCQSAGVVADIVDNSGKLAAVRNYPVVEALLENID